LSFRLITESLAQNELKMNNQKVTTSSNPNQNIPTDRERVVERVERMERERVDSPPPPYGQQTVREPPPPPENKPWGYSGIDLMNTGAAFWQNYSDMDEGDLPLPAAPGSDSQQAALNYSTLASAVASANGPSQDPSISSTETLLRNIQGLLKVAADNARQQERQINYEKGTNSNMVYLLSLAQYYMYLAATQKC
jgi:hypothetical protein